MGIFYSHIVFQPPSPPTYSDDAGVMSFRKARQESSEYESEDEQSAAQSTDATAAPSSDQSYVQHPIVYLTTSRGNTIPSAFFHQPGSYYTILFSHGNGEDLGITASYILELSNSLNTSVLCYDYSGYGLSTGKASEANCYADIQAAYTYLVSERRIPPQRIVLFGRSLGSGPTIDLACKLDNQLGGVVLIAALTSCVRVVFNSISTMKFDMFVNIDKIHRIEVPVFNVHGMMDEVVPFGHGLELSRRAKYPLEPLWIRGAGHNNLESGRFQSDVFARYIAVLRELYHWKPPPPVRVQPIQFGAHTHRRPTATRITMPNVGVRSPVSTQSSPDDSTTSSNSNDPSSTPTTGSTNTSSYSVTNTPARSLTAPPCQPSQHAVVTASIYDEVPILLDEASSSADKWNSPNGKKRRESFGPLAKAVECFGVHVKKHDEARNDNLAEEGNENLRRPRRNKRQASLHNTDIDPDGCTPQPLSTITHLRNLRNTTPNNAYHGSRSLLIWKISSKSNNNRRKDKRRQQKHSQHQQQKQLHQQPMNVTPSHVSSSPSSSSSPPSSSVPSSPSQLIMRSSNSNNSNSNSSTNSPVAQL